jgi:hypothetical protein
VIRRIQVAEQADNVHRVAFLALDELALEKLDQRVALAGVEGVLAQFQHRAATDGLCRLREGAGERKRERERVG